MPNAIGASTEWELGYPCTPVWNVHRNLRYGVSLIRRNGEFFLYDGLGSARTYTNASGAVTASAVYDGFGNTVATSGSTSSPYQFGATSGYRNDGDAGIMQVGARYYDPATGSFLTRETDLNQLAYVYCGDDPIDKLDPSGHDDTPVAESGGLLGSLGYIFSMLGKGSTTTYTTPGQLSQWWGIYKAGDNFTMMSGYSISTETTTTVTGIGLTTIDITLLYPATVIGGAYCGYKMSNWFVTKTEMGQSLTSWLGRAMHNMGAY